MRSLLFVAALSFASLAACGGRRGPVLRAGEAAEEHDPGVADQETWMTLATQRARVRVPPGWRYAKKDGALVAESPDRKAALVLAGVSSPKELASTLRTLGTRYAVEKVSFGKAPRPAKLHGMEVGIVEDSEAVCGGKPASVVVVVGDAPAGGGVVVLFVVALDEGEAYDTVLIDAANSLRPG